MLLLFEFLDIMLLLVMIASFIIVVLHLYFYKLSMRKYWISFDRNASVITRYDFLCNFIKEFWGLSSDIDNIDINIIILYISSFIVYK